MDSINTLTPDMDQSQRYRVTVEQYVRFRRDGFLVVPQLVAPHEVDELRRHTEDLMQGRLPEQRQVMERRDIHQDTGVTVQKLDAPPEDLSPAEKARFFLRIHMLHRKLELHERYMLHPRALDVLEALIGPDVLALQTMLFLKPPGKPGQGWHQDSYYIPTHPDTLCGAWIAIDDCDEQNGAMWFAKGSGVEPIYPPCPEAGYGFGDRLVGDIMYVRNVSDPNDEKNMLAKVADRYDQVLVSARAGDVVFFNGHVLHRSKKNWSADRFRRSFVSHYCNARSFTQWGAEAPNESPLVLRADQGAGSFNEKSDRDATASPTGKPVPPRKFVGQSMSNDSHILARGDTHLPFARPRFGTPCAALLDAEERQAASQYAARIMAAANNGLLGCAIADPNVKHEHDEQRQPTKDGY